MAQDDDEVFALLADPSFDAHRIAVLKGHAPSVSPATGDAEAVAVVERTPTRMRFQANLSSPGLLVLSQANYPGWEATVNGDRVPLLEADGLLPAVALPAGDTAITFRYQPTFFYTGLGVSAVTLLVSLAVAAIARWQKKDTRHFGAEQGV